MADYDYMQASDGTGDAPLMHVSAVRSIGSSTLTVDTVTKAPAKFIGTVGTPLPTGLLDPATTTNFKGHITSGAIQIDAYEPGSTDIGNVAGQVVIIKPTTGWADRVASFIKNATGFGTPENLYAAILTATSTAISGVMNAASAAISGSLTVGGNVVVTGTTRVVSVSTATATTITPTSQMYNVTALASSATVAVPSFSASDGMSMILRILDNGSAEALTFAADYTNVSGLATPSTTVAGKLLTIGAIYNSATSKWEIQGINQSA